MANVKGLLKGLPTNLDAERFVLGSVLLDPAFYSRVADALQAEDFALEKHRRIFRRMGELHLRNEVIDRVTVANELDRHRELEACDGLSYLVSLDDGLPTIPNIDSYVRIVRDKSSLRRIIFLGRKAIDTAMMDKDPPEAILGRLSKSVARMEIDSGQKSSLVGIMDIMRAHPDGIPGFLDHALTPGISTGFVQLDDKIMGLHKQNQYVIAGATGSGKSAFAMNIAVNLAKAGHPIAVYALEMSKELTLARMICCEARVPLRAHLRSELMSEQRNAVTKAAFALSEIPLFIDETPGLTITQLVSRVGRAVIERRIVGYVLDYLQLLDYQSDHEMKFRTEYEAVTYASRTCRMLTRQHDIFSLILSQLSRPADKRKDAERPKLSDLRSSGQIEQDATAVAMLYREELFKPGDQNLRGKAEALIRKSRMGTTGTCELEFIGKYTRFIDHGLPEGFSGDQE